MKPREYKVTYRYIDSQCVEHDVIRYSTADSFTDAVQGEMFDIVSDLTNRGDLGVCQVKDAIMVFYDNGLYRFYYDFIATYAD